MTALKEHLLLLFLTSRLFFKHTEIKNGMLRAQLQASHFETITSTASLLIGEGRIPAQVKGDAADCRQLLLLVRML